MHEAAVKTALITGASSGIGAAYAHELAAQGYDLILVARRADRLQALASEIRQDHDTGVEVLVGDLTRPLDMERVEERIAKCKALTLLINNAGFGIRGMFIETDMNKNLNMIMVHVVASMRFTRAALPGMIARRHGIIINISSLAALIPLPGHATYCATKAYLITFSKTLAAELKGRGVKIQVLCPGFTTTGFHDSAEYQATDVRAKIPKALWMRADAVVKESLRTLKGGKVLCVPGVRNRLMAAGGRLGLAPLMANILMARLPK